MMSPQNVARKSDQMRPYPPLVPACKSPATIVNSYNFIILLRESMKISSTKFYDIIYKIIGILVTTPLE